MKAICIKVNYNLKRLLNHEDIDGDGLITKNDSGPKSFYIISVDRKSVLVKGYYALSNLLQLLARASDCNVKKISLDVKKLSEPPPEHLKKQIIKYYWDDLTRKFDSDELISLIKDPKMRGKGALYVPENDLYALKYFRKLSLKAGVNVIPLPLQFDQSQINKSGLLSLSPRASPRLKNPYIVPGGRFNEMYGWDSYFIILGLLKSRKKAVAISILKHLIYQIKHYGKVLNANRSYYLYRSQPPFMTSIIKALLKGTKTASWLNEALSAVIDEYQFFWMNSEHLCSNNLNRYFCKGEKESIEVEADHYTPLYARYAKKRGLSVEKYRAAYLKGAIQERGLDELFKHDLSMRESGHDTTYRLLNTGAYLNTVDLNSLLYKYEVDIADLISGFFDDRFVDSRGYIHCSQDWRVRAENRLKLMQKYMWNEKKGLFFDYNFKKKEQETFISATTFYPLFAKMLNKEQAVTLIKEGVSHLEEKGGIASSTRKSRGTINKNRPSRQWDYPFGWAPHQMLIWRGCLNYHQTLTAQRLAYKWLYMITCAARDYNGAITEKYDVVNASHLVEAEYGNVGLQFKHYPDGGFGWSNAFFFGRIRRVVKCPKETF